MWFISFYLFLVSALKFLFFFAVMLVLFMAGTYVLARVTSNAFRRMREGFASEEPQKRDAARAAAYDLGGKMVGLALVLGSAMFHSVGLMELIGWGLAGVIVLVVVFYLFEKLTPLKVMSAIPAGNVEVAVLASWLSMAVGLLIGSLIDY